MTRHSQRWGIALGVVLALLLTTVVNTQPFNTQIQLAINQLTTGIIPFARLRMATSAYINWGSGTDVNGYGIRDNGGTIEIKNSGGSWTVVVGGSGLPTNASYWTRVPEASLSNETPLSTLATALILNTTATGVPQAYTGTSCTNQFARALSAVGVATCASVDLNLDTTGTLPVSRGGTGLVIGTSGGVLSFTGSTTLASSGVLTASAIMLGGGAGATPGVLASLGTTTTVLHGNAAGPPSFGAVSLTADVSGILPTANGGTANAFFTVSGPAASAKTFTFPNASSTVLTSNAAVTAAQGGTGLATYAIGDLIQATGATTLARLAAVATGNVLISGGVGVVSSWGKVGLTTHVSGTLGATNGGTGLAAYTTGDLIYANSGTTLAALADVAAGSYLRSGGVGVAPLWSTATLPNTATAGDLLHATAANTYGNLGAVAAGSYLRSNGVGAAPIWSTTLLPNTATTGDLLSVSAANTYANVAAVAVGQVLISQGVATLPAWSTALRISTLNLGANLTFSSAAPTISAGFGAGAAVTAGTSASFRVDIGAASMSGTIGLPAAATGWNCDVEDLTATLANAADVRTVQISSTTTTAVFENQTVSTGAAVNWGANDILAIKCAAF